MVRMTLTVLWGDEVEQKLVIEDPGIYHVGRGPDCDLRLYDRKVSKHHFAVEVTPAENRVIDLGSTNGTIVDGMLILGSPLQNPSRESRDAEATAAVNRADIRTGVKSSAPIFDDSTIELGATRITVRLDTPSESVINP